MPAKAVLVFICLTLCSIGAAEAQSARKRAGKHARQGKVYERSGQHLKAIAEFKLAYKLVPHPAMFYNIALNYRSAGDVANAINYFKQYTAIVRRGRRAARARSMLKKLRRQYAKQAPERRRRAAAEKAKAERAERERRRNAAATERRRTQQAEQDRERKQRANALAETRRRKRARRERRRRQRSSSTSGGKGLRVTGLITVGLGAIGLALGTKFGMDAQSISDELSQDATGAWTQAELDREAEGESAQTKQILFTSVGAAAVIVGGVMYLLGRSAAKPNDRLTVAPVVTPHQLGWAVAGRF